MKNKIKNKLYSNRYIIAAFFCSALIMSVIYAIKHIYPFGDQTLLKVDLYHQYAPYLEELRSRIL
ncbi:MAG: YfhO family protein, partial [Blautia sp.]|nr:YfhO family protein [Clostridia bacterium]MDY4694359.1 YfhO family protein [Blautia sp.]MDY5554481.1 YfhO family protein [Blautia sp.]